MLRTLVAFALLVTLCKGVTVRGREEPEAVGLDEATVEKIAPNLAQMAHDMFSGKKPEESLVKATAVDLMRGGPQPSWTKNLGGPYWKYGMCSSSSFWKTAGFGAPWFVHAGGVSRVKKLKVGGAEAREIESVFAVLNADYYSIFQNLNDAKQCSKPLIHYAVKDITEVRTASEYYMTSQRMGVLGSGGGDVPAKGMEYCFRMIVKNSLVNPHVFCCDLHAERSQWVSSIKKQMELNQLSSNGLQETPTLRGASHVHFPPAPNTICGVADGSPCLAALPPPPPQGVECVGSRRCETTDTRGHESDPVGSVGANQGVERPKLGSNTCCQARDRRRIQEKTRKAGHFGERGRPGRKNMPDWRKPVLDVGPESESVRASAIATETLLQMRRGGLQMF